MAAQSRPPILITRPEPQASRFARLLRAQDWVGRVHVSPLIEARDLPLQRPEGRFQGLILTSETAARAAGRLTGLPSLAWCVGDRTAQVARALGFQAVSARGDADALVARILAERQPGPLLYLHGRDTRGNVAERLNSAGTETYSALIYAQEPRPLTPRAGRLIRGSDPLVLPVFSPRTAELLVAEWRRLGGRAPAHVVALSPAVARVAAPLPAAEVTLADRPDGESLLSALKAVMCRAPWA